MKASDPNTLAIIKEAKSINSCVEDNFEGRTPIALAVFLLAMKKTLELQRPGVWAQAEELVKDLIEKCDDKEFN